MRDPFNIKAQAGAVFDEKMRKREIGQRIMQAMSDIGITPEALAEKVELKVDSLKNYTQGRAEPKDNFYQVLRDLGINPEWVRYGTGSRFADDAAGETLKGRHNEVVRYASKNVSAIDKLRKHDEQFLAAQKLQEQISDKKFQLSEAIAFIKDMFRVPIAQTDFVTEAQLFVRAGKPTAAFDLPSANNSASIFYVGISGDSMVGLDIHDGDILMMQRQITFKNQDIILARLDDELTIKQVQNGNGYLLLNPGNPDYEPIKVTPNLDFECMGVWTKFKRRD